MRRPESKSDRKKELPRALVSVERWFSKKMEEKKLKSWQLNEIKSYFGAHGLSERETLEDFENCFKRFEGVR